MGNPFPPSRTAALERLRDFVPRAGRDYASRRNHDLGPGRHEAVSQLSPYLRHRVLTEKEVLSAVLARHSLGTAEKFVQEVFWRTYWKGWLEMRSGVWRAYQHDLIRRLDEVQTQAGLRDRWQSACRGETGLVCFDAWARDLAETGYLHNHARMWFASIWIFTLRLPWELGADFFLRHLLDGDPASNTLGWRWVAGLQTRGKHYLTRSGNIEKYTGGRFAPAAGDLTTEAAPLEGPPHPPRSALPERPAYDPRRPTALVLHEEDLSPGWILDEDPNLVGAALLRTKGGLTPLQPARRVTAFRKALLDETAARWSGRIGDSPQEIGNAGELSDWAQAVGAEQIVTAFAPVGPVADVLRQVHDIPVVQTLRAYDARAWPHATAGFFKFRQQIPRLLGEIRGLRAA